MKQETKDYIKELAIYTLKIIIYFTVMSVLFLHFTMIFFYIWWKLGLGDSFILSFHSYMAMIASAFIAWVVIKKGFTR